MHPYKSHYSNRRARTRLKSSQLNFCFPAHADDSYLAFSNYDLKLIERNDEHIFIGVVEMMGTWQQWELLKLVY